MKRIYFICLFLCLTTFAARPAHAQTETVLYNFCSQYNCSDGEAPGGNLTSNGGNFYGTTGFGGLYGDGTVFELSPNGNGGWNETVLYNLCSNQPFCFDGRYPTYSSVIFDSQGNLYGTTVWGGADNYGEVFELSPAGASWTEAVLFSFANSDGAHPISGLIMDPAGNLYGTTLFGGANGYGTVFELSPSGGGWTEQVIYDAGGDSGLTMDTAGNIYGTTTLAVFELSPNGNGGWNPTVIHTFPSGAKDGSVPWGTPVLDKAGNLYGTTYEGGAHNDGTVYKLTPVTKGKNKGTWKERILYSFKGGTNDGCNPEEAGIVFDTAGKGGTKDGCNPQGAGIVFDTAGDIYGTTYNGGTYGLGTVYELVADDGKYKEKVLWSFNSTDGANPSDSLILDSAGNLYGTAESGGGVVFEVTP